MSAAGLLPGDCGRRHRAQPQPLPDVQQPQGERRLLGKWLSVFYGYPTFAWIPTHNLNHHKHVNKAGDATITWRYTNRHNWLTSRSRTSSSPSYFQSEPDQGVHPQGAREQPRALPADRHAVRGVGRRARGCSWRWPSRCTASWQGVVRLAVRLRDPGVLRAVDDHALQLHPARPHRPLVARTTTRAASPAGLINFFLFNNGLHAAHHENPGAHWSKLPEAHAEIEAEIHPDLKPRSFFWWCFAQLRAGALLSRASARQQIGRAAYDVPGGEPQT